jgi:hypothetical protein
VIFQGFAGLISVATADGPSSVLEAIRYGISIRGHQKSRDVEMNENNFSKMTVYSFEGARSLAADPICIPMQGLGD